MAPDIEAAHTMLKEEEVWKVVKNNITKYNEENNLIESRPPSPTTSFSERYRKKSTQHKNTYLEDEVVMLENNSNSLF